MSWVPDTFLLPYATALQLCSALSLARTQGMKLMSRSLGGSWDTLLGGASGYTEVLQGALQHWQLYHSQRGKGNSNDAAKRSCVRPGAAPGDVCVTALPLFQREGCDKLCSGFTTQCP